MEENYIMNLSEENICLEFSFGDKMYAVVSREIELGEDGEIYLVKVSIVDGVKLLRNIDSDEEYSKVEEEYERILSQYDWEDAEDV